jgi:hypothetical protein
MVYDRIDEQNYLMVGHFNGMLGLYVQLEKINHVDIL